jgi:Ca-activated chloride channel homolog
MTFAQPLWIIAGLIVCIGTLFLLRSLQSRRQATLEKFVAAHLLERLTRNVSIKRQFIKKTLFLLALFCCFLALARPQYGFRWEDVKRKGIDILFAVDTSRSMLAQDIKPNRLERAKYAIMDFVEQLNGDRIGLLPFAGTAFLMCPLTGDYSAFENSLKEINTTIIPKGGTDIAAAIREAQSVLTDKANTKLLIMITDGENLQGNALAAAEEAAEKGMRIFTVGVGTREGEIVPISSGGTQGFMKDASGNFVVSRLDEATLTGIADKSNGFYTPLGNKGQGLQTIYQKKLSLIPKEELTDRRHKVPLERFEWPLAAAIGLLALEFMIGSRKSRPFRLPFRKISGHSGERKVLGFLILVTACSLFSWPASTHASEGEKAFNKGDYQKASEFYGQLLKKHPDDPRLQYNFGTAAYKDGKYNEAIAAFTEALKSTDLDLQDKAYYNRGNAHFRKGEETQDTDPQLTLAEWQNALDSYNASLELKPDDQNAINNKKLGQKRIDELKKKEKMQQKQDHDKTQKTDDTKDQQDNQKDQQEQSPKDSNPQQQKPGPQQNGQNEDETKQDGSVMPKTSEQQKQSSTQAQESKENAGIDNERRKKGKMTREDAEQLLNSLKNEEGKALNFAPIDRKNKDDKPGRDW